jgi:hypothetical protein
VMDRGIERALRGHSVDEFAGEIGAHAKQALGVSGGAGVSGGPGVSRDEDEPPSR